MINDGGGRRTIAMRRYRGFCLGVDGCVKRSIPYLDGGGGCFSQLASITKHTNKHLQ
jgi:hypothetical protein